MPDKKKIIIIVVVAAVVAVMGLIIFSGGKEPPPQQVELEMWGIYDDSDIFEQLIGSFNQTYPHIQIKYYKKNQSTYEKDLLEAMASGRGPDIFMIHHTWPSRYGNKISAAPSDLILLKDFQESFVDVVVDDFVSNGLVTAVPLGVDTLALYYNKDIFNTLGIPEPPKTWEEFLDDVDLITEISYRDNVTRAGAAIGTVRNINRSTDILCLLMLQSGAEMVDENKRGVIFDQPFRLDGKSFYPAERALKFYTDFTDPLKPIYTWNTRMDYSIDVFYRGDAAMMFNYSYHIPTIRAKAPYLNFGVAPMPQIEGSTKNIDYANYWGLTVSKKSRHPREAWVFNAWISRKENHQRYLQLTERPTARRDLVAWQRTDPDLGIFADQSLTAKSWYQVDNLSIETILADMIESVVIGEATIKDSIKYAVNRINLLMR